MYGEHNRKREHSFEQLAQKQYDLIVIGGGITGAGIALDAAARGLAIALVEMQDFAAGTSSRSTKLIHGGLRYLKQLELGVVAEVGRERAIVYENGPHVTTPEWMLLPLYEKGTYGKWSTTLGLTLYDLLAQVKKSERKKMLTKRETLSLAPLLKQDGLVGGGYYVEYKTDDARLTIEVMKKAQELGATVINYAKVQNLRYVNGSVVGVQVEDTLTEQCYEVKGKKVVNATGPWVDDIRELDGSKSGKTLMLTKGVHLVFDQQHFPLKQAVYFDTPDGRMCFAIPRGEKTYFGTTDTNYTGEKINPTITAEDSEYLLRAVNYIFPMLKLTASHIESSYAGLRPLIHQEGKAASEVSRKDELFISQSGLISIAGGKLTGYRKMAEHVVNKVVALLKKEGHVQSINNIDTKNIPISGGDVGGSKQLSKVIEQSIINGEKAGLTAEEAQLLAKRYGSNFNVVLTYLDDAKRIKEEVGLDLDIALMLCYGIAAEMVVTLEDFLIRRTGFLLFDVKKAEENKIKVAKVLAITFNWTLDHYKIQLENFDKKLKEIKVII